MRSGDAGFTWYIWALAMCSLIILAFDLLFFLPHPSKPIESEKSSVQCDHSIPESCCVATLLNNDNALNVVTLGHSLSETSSSLPSTFAIMLEDIPREKLDVISNYFNIINATDKSPPFPELLFWSKLKHCMPVIAVSALGVFTNTVNDLCHAKPFSSVSANGDVVYFDPSLMILDPNDPPNTSHHEKTWSKFVNKAYLNWNPLPPRSSVNDYANAFLEFSLNYAPPTYVHFKKPTFHQALIGSSETSGSKKLYEVIKRAVNSAKLAHANIF